MRALRTLRIATPAALVALALIATDAHLARAERWIVRLAPPPPALPGALRATHLADQRERFSARARALGVTPLRTLDADLPAAGLAGLSAAPRAAAGAAPEGNPFDLDPSRTWLVDVAEPALAPALAADPEVLWAEPDQVRSICVEPESFVFDAAPLAAAALAPGFPNDPMFRDTRQWGLWNAGPAGVYRGRDGADVAALDAWTLTTGSHDVKLAIADTGVDPAHPELVALVPGVGERVTDGFNATLNPSVGYADSFGHGTPVAGVFAARTHNGAFSDSLGVAGLAGGDGAAGFGCRLVPIRITEGRSGDAYSFDIARAILYATAVGARALNLSFAGSGPSRAEREALYHALTRGCVVVAAAGNRGTVAPTAPQYPAAYAREGLCIQVGASDASDRRAAFSSYGPGLDFLAPGVNVWTTFMTYRTAAGVLRNGYAAVSGTSLAAPFGTGAVGLLASLRPELADRDFQVLLREAADDLGARGPDAETGWGRLDVARALRAVPPTFGVWHDEVPAASWTPLGRGDLEIGDYGPGSMSGPRLWPDAQLVEVRATVALPDTFLDSVRVWPRVGGTMALRGDFRLGFFAPWAEIVARDARSFTVRGYLYRVEDDCDGCPDGGWVPLPPDMARFGLTVIGRVDRAPALAVSWPALPAALGPGDTLRVRFSATDPDEVTAVEVWLEPAGAAPVRLARVPGAAGSALVTVPCAPPGAALLRVTARDEHGPALDETSATLAIGLRKAVCPEPPALRITPNPVFGAATIVAPGAGSLALYDAAGRLVRRVALEDERPRWTWDGRDAAGRRAAPGIYFARFEGPRGTAAARLVRMD
uniref:Peptidase S8/S53 domain-containing protein n=1 Tax=Eiseniibacteriota bacterium TaxID=2212470 RepID=A0A832MLD1_UNCEI